MPRPPHTAASVAEIPGAVYSALADRLARYRGEVYPLHVGDTWMEPPPGCRMEDFRVADHPGMHRYAAPQDRLVHRYTCAGIVVDPLAVPPVFKLSGCPGLNEGEILI